MQILSILALSLTATANAALTNKEVCHQKCNATKSGTCVAIKEFCSKTDLTANSDYSMHGSFSGYDNKGMRTHVFVAPKNNCPSNSDWIPQKYCLSQFYEVCAKGDKFGHGEREYGVDGCQQFNSQNA